jgi:Transport and Golgi organisation 2
MCTVSFVRANDSVIITSNRDEHIGRENATAPALHVLQHKNVIFPQDARAGGTWFAAASNGTVAVLLNGAFKKHVAKPPYRKSRGLILLENIEPFTVVLYQPGSLHELRWDGSLKYEKEMDVSGNYIWSSATLYSDVIIEQRKHLFQQFMQGPLFISSERVQEFHAGNNGDDENGFIINRQTGMKTFSITQAMLHNQTVNFLHKDLLQQKQYAQTLAINHAAIPV